MKKMIALLMVVMPFAGFAQDIGTQDNVNYVIVLTEGLSAKQTHACVHKICALSEAQGTGYCQHLESIGIVVANLTTLAADQVIKTNCVYAIEPEGEMGGWPTIL